jgi:hypothetical protein
MVGMTVRMTETTQNPLKLLIFLALLAVPSLAHAQCGSFTPNLVLGLPTVSSIGWGTCVSTKSTDFGAGDINDSGTARNASEPLNLNNQGVSGNAAAKVASTNGIEYAASGGRDSNDGKSWGTAKATVMAAYDALPAQGGTVYVCSSLANTINWTSTGQGAWIMGPSDPNYANPPTGWRRLKSVRFVGVCSDAQGFDEPVSYVNMNSALGPEVWISSTTGQSARLTFENFLLQYANTSNVVLGVDSNGKQTSNSGVWSIRFHNIATNVSQLAGPGAGPGWYIGGGDTFNVFMDEISASGNSTAIPGSDQQAAILFKPRGGSNRSANGVITNSLVTGGGIKYYEGNLSGTMTVKDTYSEVINAGLGQVGTFWAASSGAASVTKYNIEKVFTADPIGNVCDAKFDVFAWHQGSITTSGGTEPCGNAIQQGAIVGTNLGARTSFTGDPLTQGMDGVSYGRYYGFLGNTQRQFSPSMVRYQNLAPTTSSSWTVAGAGGSIATGISAPDGTTGAARVTTSTNSITITFSSRSLPLAVGQYFVAGLWERFNSPDDYYEFSGATGVTGLAISVGGTGNRASCSMLWPPGMRTDGWTWVYQLCKVTAAPTSPATVSFISNAPVVRAHTSVMDFYAPMLLNIPSGSVSNDEVYELANNLVSYNSSCTVGTLCGITGSGGARRICDIPVGNQAESAITNAQLGPQRRLCFIPTAATIVEMDVAADDGTPNVIVGLNHAGTVSNIVSSALATATSGGIACSNTGGTTGIDGATKCSATLQNTSVAAGDYLELVSGTAGGKAKLMTIHVTYTVK